MKTNSVYKILFIFFVLSGVTSVIAQKADLKDRILKAVNSGSEAMEIGLLDEQGQAQGDYNLLTGKWEPYEPAWHTGQIIYALTRAYDITKNEKYIEVAKRAGDWWVSLEIKDHPVLKGMVKSIHGAGVDYIVFATMSDGSAGLFRLFDITGDGKGDIWGGGFGWYVTEMTKYKIRDYGLNFDQLVLEQYAFMTILTENMRRKKPILFVFWTPEWPFAVYDLSWVDEPQYDPEKYKFVPGKPDESYVASADPKTLTYVGFSKKLQDRLPRAYKFFKNWHISGVDVSQMLAEVQDIPDNPKKDPIEVAKKWVADHQDIVNGWVKGIE